MTQEQIKEHILEYTELNANDKIALEVANEIIIKEILENDIQ